MREVFIVIAVDARGRQAGRQTQERETGGGERGSVFAAYLHLKRDQLDRRTCFDCVRSRSLFFSPALFPSQSSILRSFTLFAFVFYVPRTSFAHTSTLPRM